MNVPAIQFRQVGNTAVGSSLVAFSHLVSQKKTERLYMYVCVWGGSEIEVSVQEDKMFV